MALSILPQLIDVNVHPTKKTVIFERSDDLCEQLTETIESLLQDACSNRSFVANPKQDLMIKGGGSMSSQMPYVHMREPSDHHLKTVSAIKMVRTDS